MFVEGVKLFHKNFLGFMAVLLMGCTMARMRVRPQLVSAAQEMKVEGRKTFSFDETFFFGSYQVTEVHRGWTRSTGFSISRELEKKFSGSKATQKYEFLLKDGKEDVWECQSITECDQYKLDSLLGKKNKLGIGINTKNILVCTFKSRNRPEEWQLMMDENYDSSNDMKGELSDGKISIFVQGTRKLAGAAFPMATPTGYEFLMDENIVGSVEVINKGAVWIIPSIEERLHSPLAVTSAALLLYQNIGR
jgi:hypothetical protein